MPDADITISDDTKKQFPDLVDLILHSESMNTEERKYWINMLPSMKPSQRDNLREILENERSQLAEIDSKYAKDIDAMGQEELQKTIDDKRRARRLERTAEESQFETKDSLREEELLHEIEDL